MKFDSQYYKANSQDRDRPALLFYERLWRRYSARKPVLEFGCGVGFFARRLQRYTQVYGYEINEYASSRLKINAPAVQLVHDLSEIADASLGSVTALHVLEHIPDAELRVLGHQFRRILSSRGRMLVVMPDLSGHAHLLKGNAWSGLSDETHINLKSSAEWRTFFERQWGFKIIRCAADGYYDFPYAGSLSGLIKDGCRAARTGIQFLSGNLILKPGDGEAAIFILEKQE